jgi:Transposase
MSQVRAWITRGPEELADKTASPRRTTFQLPDPERRHQTGPRLADMLRRRGGHNLIGWIKTAEDSDIPELATFATGLRADFDAVTAGFTLRHNSGPVEGHVSRIKMIKRTPSQARCRQPTSRRWLSSILRPPGGTFGRTSVSA